ncbi:TIGR04282 family arsenosugar biosynthesis glycosyltransferase [Mycolicibacterium brisbanense]
MKPVVVLVVAKAPVPGLAKTRLAAGIGAEAAAEIAAAALLDTLDAAAAATAQARVVALTGDLDRARRSHEIRDRLADFVVVPQRGEDFAERLANAHADAAASAGLPVLQVGMDTPQISAALLDQCADALSDADAVLGMARDGGWWVLGVRDSRTAACLADVEMSTPQTGAKTLAALRDTGAKVALTAELADFDTVDDISEVRGACSPGSRFVRATQGM